MGQGMGQVSHTIRSFPTGLASIGFLALAALPLQAAETVRMEGSFIDNGAANAAPIIVSGRAGRFDRVTAATLHIPLKLEATLGEGGSGRKILGSELFLKQSGAAGTAATDAREGTVPRAQLAHDKAFAFIVDPVGPLAQDAIALCNSQGVGNSQGAAARATMSLPVLWRVTTGRFNFKWVNYDQVGPSDEIVSNPEFYADRETQEIAIAASVPVSCETDGKIAAAPVAHSKPAPLPAATPAVQKAVPAKKAVEVSPQQVSQLQPVALEEPDAGEIAAKPLSVATPETRLVCEGGMVRSSGAAANDVCLCPGNTRRVETGAHAYSCERKVGRR